MVYMPKAKLLIQADAYIPRPGAPPLPTPSPYTTNLVDNVSRLKLDVARVVHVHGGSSPYSDVLAAAGTSGLDELAALSTPFAHDMPGRDSACAMRKATLSRVVLTAQVNRSRSADRRPR